MRFLTNVYYLCIYIHMRTNIILQDDLVSKAARLTKITKKTDLVHEGLRALIEKYSGMRLAALGGSEPNLKFTPRRHSKTRAR